MNDLSKHYTGIIAAIPAKVRNDMVRALEAAGDWGAYFSDVYDDRHVVYRNGKVTVKWAHIASGGFLSALGCELARAIKAARSADL